MRATMSQQVFNLDEELTNIAQDFFKPKKPGFLEGLSPEQEKELQVYQQQMYYHQIALQAALASRVSGDTSSLNKIIGRAKTEESIEALAHDILLQAKPD